MVSRLYQQHYSAADDARTVRTREALRDALLKLLEEKALDRITIRDIAANAGISYVTFFRHHTTKEALLQDIAAGQVRRLAELMMPAIDASDTRAASTALCEYVDCHRKLWSTLLTGGAAAVMREEFLSHSAKIAATHADPTNSLPPELAVTLSVSSTIEVLTWWLRQESPVSVARIAEIHERTMIMSTTKARRARTTKVARKIKITRQIG
jgi:AcrR family transcriptional regulator